MGFLSIVSILLAVNLGATPMEIGWIGTTYGLMYTLVPMLIGPLTDRISRKVNLLIVTGAQTVTVLFYIFAVNTFMDLIIGQAIYGILYSVFWVNGDAYISEETETDSKRHHMTFFNYCVGWTLGSGLAPLFGGFFADLMVTTGFWLVFTIYIVGFCIVLIGIPNRPPMKILKQMKASSPNEEVLSVVPSSSTNTVSKSPSNPSSGTLSPATSSTETLSSASLSPKPLSPVILLLFTLFQTAMVKILLGYFPNYAATPDGLGWSGTLLGRVIVWFGIARVLYFIAGRYWANNFKILPIFLILLGGIVLQFVWVKDPFVYGILFAFAGLLIARTYITVFETMIGQEKAAKGAKAGLFESFLGIGMSLTPLIAGWLGNFHLLLPFLIFGIVTMSFGCGMLVYFRRAP